MNGAVVLGWEINGTYNNASFNANLAREDIAEFRELRPYFRARLLSADGIFDLGRGLGGVPVGPAGGPGRHHPGLPAAPGGRRCDHDRPA